MLSVYQVRLAEAVYGRPYTGRYEIQAADPTEAEAVALLHYAYDSGYDADDCERFGLHVTDVAAAKPLDHFVRMRTPEISASIAAGDLPGQRALAQEIRRQAEALSGMSPDPLTIDLLRDAPVLNVERLADPDDDVARFVDVARWSGLRSPRLDALLEQAETLRQGGNRPN